jgi:hypothetical protein
MQTQLIPVPFYEDTLVLVNSDNEPVVAMKPIVENMGLDWKGQHVKLSEKFNSVMEIISTTGGDGKTYEMVCLPLRKIPAWLYSINPNKVSPEIRTKVERYQNECDDVLWNYWTKGSAQRPGALNVTERLRVQQSRIQLFDQLEAATHPLKRAAIHEHLTELSSLLGYAAPDITAIGSNEPEEHPCISAWWEALDELVAKGAKINHARDSANLAINLTQIRQLAIEHHVELPNMSSVRKHIKLSKQPRYVQTTVVNSKFANKAVRCFVFVNDISCGH